MPDEKNCPRENRVLPIIAEVTKADLASEEYISNFFEGNEQVDWLTVKAYFEREKSENELLVYCGFGYCDAPLPKKYNCLIDADDPDHPVPVSATVEFAISNGLLPTLWIDHGHRTYCLISFENGIPARLTHLPDWNDLQAGNYRYDQFGLCDKADAAVIVRRIKKPTRESKSGLD